MAEITKISTKGQVVIPREIREKLGISASDALQVEQVGDLIVLKKLDLTSLADQLSSDKKKGEQKTRRGARK